MLAGGLYVATICPFDETGKIDFGRLHAHCQWLIEGGIEGIVGNGGVGEYKSLDRSERERVIATLVEAAGGKVPILAGTGAPSGTDARYLAEQAADAGAVAVQAPPPYGYAATKAEIVRHYEELAKSHLSIILYNNTTDTVTDLSPDLISELVEIEGVVGIKEFSGDVRRIRQLRERFPDLLVLCGSDDLVLESVAAGAHGWIGGFPNVYPAACRRLLDLLRGDRVAKALELYSLFLPVFRWDAHPLYVQAIKLAMDLEGLAGGAVRLPRLSLSEPDAARIRDAVAAVKGGSAVATIEPS